MNTLFTNTNTFSDLSLVDREIYDIVKLLNLNNYKTYTSCSGHGQNCSLGIIFESLKDAFDFINFNLSILNKYNVSWYIKNKHLNSKNKCEYEYTWKENIQYINTSLLTNYKNLYFVSLKHYDLSLLKNAIYNILNQY